MTNEREQERWNVGAREAGLCAKKKTLAIFALVDSDHTPLGWGADPS